MAFSPTDFADDTDFERLALELLGSYRVRVGKVGMIFHDEAHPAGGRRIAISASGGASLGGRAREELRQSLSPLGFGAAYKILDVLAEHVLRANGVGGARLSFARKNQILATRPANLPVPLDGRPDVWDRITAVYMRLQDARHAVTHRRAQLGSNGDLEVYDDHRVVTDTISSAEIAAFVAAVHALAEAVIARDADHRRMNIVAWHLNKLSARHGLSVIAATDAEVGRRLLITELVSLDGGLARFDVGRAREIVAGQSPGPWDLQLRAGTRVFVGRWEGVPDDGASTIDLHPDSPPAWLSEQVA